MLLIWKIRYLDRPSREMQDRELWLDTSTLDPVTRAAVELSKELDGHDHEKRVARFRSLFQEKIYTQNEVTAIFDSYGKMDCFSIPDYFENETGEKISKYSILSALRPEHAENKKSSVTEEENKHPYRAREGGFNMADVTLNQSQIASLGYFTRDLRELIFSEFVKEGPGKFVVKGSESYVQTSTTSDEIKSFITTFRRLYMTGEPGSFVKAVDVFSSIPNAASSGLATWLSETYKNELEKPVEGLQAENSSLPITKKLLIDAFIYTQYAHQPDNRRTKQFNRCLQAVEGNSSRLVWLFLTTVWQMTFPIRNAGKEIVSFYEKYIQLNEESDNIVVSVVDNNPGIGSLEKKSAREDRLFREKAEDISIELWKEKGRPRQGHAVYFEEACRSLKQALERTYPSNRQKETHQN